MIERVMAVLLTLPIALAAQASHKKNPSSAEMKKQMMASYVFQATDIFYPDGPAQASYYPKLSDSGFNLLESGLKGLLPVVADLHARNVEVLSRMFGRQLAPAVRATVVVENLNAPIAQSMVNEQGALEIRVDVHVLQATFRASLLSALRDLRVWRAELGKKVEMADDELIREFLTFKKQVVEAKAGSKWGDVRGNGDNDRWSAMLDLAERSNDIQTSYTGTLMFLIAHEAGHFVLGHHQHSCDVARCDLFSADELEADRYAGYLQGALVAPMTYMDEMTMGMLSLMDPSHRKKLAGFSTFFDDAYSRVGFVDPSKARCACAYPDPAVRREAAEAGQKAASERYKQLVETDPAAAQKTTPMKVMLPQHRVDRTDSAESLIAEGKYDEALELVKLDANSGSPSGMFYLGYFYDYGLAVKQDYGKAREWYEKAAAAGVGEAMAYLGLLYHEGRGVQPDLEKARDWCEKGVAAGSARALGLRSAMFYAGEAGPQDYEQARKGFEAAGAAGDVPSMGFLCLMYQQGKGISVDYAQALHWCQRGADGGNQGAMLILAEMYEQGQGVKQDHRLARQWQQKADALEKKEKK